MTGGYGASNTLAKKAKENQERNVAEDVTDDRPRDGESTSPGDHANDNETLVDTRYLISPTSSIERLETEAQTPDTKPFTSVTSPAKRGRSSFSGDAGCFEGCFSWILRILSMGMSSPQVTDPLYYFPTTVSHDAYGAPSQDASECPCGRNSTETETETVSHDERPAPSPAKYKLRSKMPGQGSFSEVWLAEHRVTKQNVAVKILDSREMEKMNMVEDVQREIDFLHHLKHHPHIIDLYEMDATPEHVFMIMEYVSGGDLLDHINLLHREGRRLREHEARRFFQQILSGVEHCHQNMIAHRDLKPDNLLLDSKLRIKIADFGLASTMKKGEFLRTTCGTSAYMSPEAHRGKYVGHQTDVWSCGVVLYAMLCFREPFEAASEEQLIWKIKHGRYELPGYLSCEAQDLISKMLHIFPERRITIPQITEEHSWFTEEEEGLLPHTAVDII